MLTKKASGSYSASLTETYLAPGTYTADNGAGGKDIGPFKTTITINSPLTWTNESSISTINRSQGVTLTWTGGDPGSYVFIQGIDAIRSPLTVTSQFLCIAPIGSGQFTVPAEVLLALPPSDPSGTSFISLGSYTLGSTISATGLDYGVFNASSAIGEGVKYQ